MAWKPKLRTNRLATTVIALMTLMISTVLSVSNFMGLTTSLTFSVIEGVALLGAGIVLLIEVFKEGERTGIRGFDEMSVMDILGSVGALGGIVMGSLALVGSVTGMNLIALPTVFKGMVLIVLPIMLTKELFSR